MGRRKSRVRKSRVRRSRVRKSRGMSCRTRPCRKRSRSARSRRYRKGTYRKQKGGTTCEACGKLPSEESADECTICQFKIEEAKLEKLKAYPKDLVIANIQDKAAYDRSLITYTANLKAQQEVVDTLRAQFAMLGEARRESNCGIVRSED